MRFSPSPRARMPHPGAVSVGRFSKAPPTESCFCTSSLDSELLVSVSCCNFLDAPGKATEGLFCRGFCARVVGSLMLKNVYFYLYLLVQCKISIWRPISIWGALWSSHPFTIALGMALARPVLEFSIHQLIYSAKYIMNMQSWLCTSVSF